MAVLRRDCLQEAHCTVMHKNLLFTSSLPCRSELGYASHTLPLGCKKAKSVRSVRIVAPSIGCGKTGAVMAARCCPGSHVLQRVRSHMLQLISSDWLLLDFISCTLSWALLRTHIILNNNILLLLLFLLLLLLLYLLLFTANTLNPIMITIFILPAHCHGHCSEQM